MSDDIFFDAATAAADSNTPTDTVNRTAQVAEQAIFNLFARRDDLGKSILKALWEFTYKGYHAALGYEYLSDWNLARLYPTYGDYATDCVRIVEHIFKPVNARAHSETPLLVGGGIKVTIEGLLVNAPMGNLRIWSPHFDKAPEMKDPANEDRLSQQQIMEKILTGTQSQNASAKNRHIGGVTVPYYDQMLPDGSHIITLKNLDGSGLNQEQYLKFLRRTRPFAVLAG